MEGWTKGGMGDGQTLFYRTFMVTHEALGR